MLLDFGVLAFRRLSGRTHRGRTFRAQQITLDHQSFIDCRFEACTLVLLGSDNVRLEGCTFIACRWAVAGYAANTVQVLKQLSGIAGVAEVIRDTFADVFEDDAESAAEGGHSPEGEGPRQ